MIDSDELFESDFLSDELLAAYIDGNAEASAGEAVQWLSSIDGDLSELLEVMDESVPMIGDNEFFYNPASLEGDWAAFPQQETLLHTDIFPWINDVAGVAAASPEIHMFTDDHTLDPAIFDNNMTTDDFLNPTDGPTVDLSGGNPEIMTPDIF